MLYGKYQFTSVFEDEAFLPPFKGSTFRGVFGHALKKVVCALNQQDCETCLLSEKCIYVMVFDTPRRVKENNRTPPPHPFVIEPPLTTRTRFLPGDRFDFTLLLFGEANHLLPYFIYAFEQMGRIGVGRRQPTHRARFQLLSVFSQDREIYQAQDRRLAISEFQHLSLEPDHRREDGGERLQTPTVTQLRVNLITPLRLKHDNRFQAELPFHVLIRAALRRIAALWSHYGNGEPALDYQGLVARSRQVRTVHATVNWFDWQRYSQRQDQRMLLGGMLGDATYAGELTEFLPLLRLAEEVHLGKATTFGLGKIGITI